MWKISRIMKTEGERSCLNQVHFIDTSSFLTNPSSTSWWSLHFFIYRSLSNWPMTQCQWTKHFRNWNLDFLVGALTLSKIYEIVGNELLVQWSCVLELGIRFENKDSGCNHAKFEVRATKHSSSTEWCYVTRNSFKTHEDQLLHDVQRMF